MARAKRKTLSQKTRFEVFKRDSFTCQYCGRKAPDVVLQVDHIDPVANGGTNDIFNLVTSCVECNQGKSDRKISEQSVVEKQRREIELRQERLEQIRMMGEWQRSLVTIEDAAIQEANSLLRLLHAGDLESHERKTVCRLVKSFGLAAVLEGIRIGMSEYDDQTETIEKLGGICFNNSTPENKVRSKIIQKVKAFSTRANMRPLAILLDRAKKIGGIDTLQILLDWTDRCIENSGGINWNKYIPILRNYLDKLESEK